MTLETSRQTGPAAAEDVETILITHTGAEPAAFDGGRDVPLEDLGIDSLAVLELQAQVTDRYGVEIPEEALRMSVAEIVDLINAKAGS